MLVVSSLLVFAAHGESSWKNFVNEEVTEVKNMFDGECKIVATK